MPILRIAALSAVAFVVCLLIAWRWQGSAAMAQKLDLSAAASAASDPEPTSAGGPSLDIKMAVSALTSAGDVGQSKGKQIAIAELPFINQL
jgi:hypothetical protein